MSFHTVSREVAHAVGGAHKTRLNRRLSLRKLAAFLQKANIQIRNLDQLKEKHLHAWIEAERAAGVTDRTCQNMLADVRVCLRYLKLNQKADAIKTANYGIANASRAGTKVAISEQEFRERLERIDDAGVKAIMNLLWYIGLRRLEGTMAQLDTLQRWKRELKYDGVLYVIAGTKGHRPRYVHLIDIQDTLAVIDEAIEIAKSRNGNLIDKPNLKQAKNRFQTVMNAAGFTGKCTPHTLRYAWTHASMQRYKVRGLSYREALVATALDLGHGEGRTQWIRNVYHLGGQEW